MHPRHFAAVLVLPLLGLAACAVQPNAPAAASKRPVYSTDMSGKAANCTTSPVTLTDGATATATITTGGGGWCGILVRRNDEPMGAGLLTEQPKNGSVYVHTVGDDTRVDYTPRAGFSGADSFAVKFIPGDAIMRVSVTSNAPPAPAAAPAPAATPAKPATPARSSHTRARK